MSLLLWLRAGHFIGLILWVGGLAALTRLLASHSARPTGPEASERLVQVEKAIYRFVAAPGAFLVFLTGIAMLHQAPHHLKQPYMHAKLTLIVGLLAIDHLSMRGFKKLAKGVGSPARTWLILHGITVAVAASIVLLIVLKPWIRG